jgi:hypothetical protein
MRRPHSLDPAQEDLQVGMEEVLMVLVAKQHITMEAAMLQLRHRRRQR